MVNVGQADLAAPEWVWRWNNSCMHGELDRYTPIEFETAYCAGPRINAPRHLPDMAPGGNDRQAGSVSTKCPKSPPDSPQNGTARLATSGTGV